MKLKEYPRRSILPLAALALAAYYVLVFMPLGRRGQSIDAPLQKAWRKLAASLDQTNAASIDFLHITNQFNETRQDLTNLQKVRQTAAARLEIGPALRARLNAPFQLVDYQNERSKEQDQLSQLAKQTQATLDPAVFAGYPEHTADVRQPEMLWAELAFVDSLLTSALQAKVSAIHSLEVPLALTNAPPANSPLTEIPVQVELTAPIAGVAQWLQTLPLRAEELRAAGYTNAAPDKPVLFLDRLVLKKQSPEKPDEVRVWLRAVGFVLRE